MKNAFSIDLEDWFCVYNFAQVINYSEWDRCELRVVQNTARLLTLLDKHETKATFFVLGWIAERCPDLIREIAAAGHEIATHGYGHIIVKDVTPEEFERDLVASLRAIQQCVNTDVIGYRAPSFSVVANKPWIFDILAANGIKYDSSIFPIGLHPDYAAAGTSLSVYNITESIVEFPLSCFRQFGITFPCSGGGYLRMFPYRYTAYGITRCNKDNRPAVIYIHPWEIDPNQPRMTHVPLLKKIRHYVNLDKTEGRVDRLLSEFAFDTCASILGLR